MATRSLHQLTVGGRCTERNTGPKKLHRYPILSGTATFFRRKPLIRIYMPRGMFPLELPGRGLSSASFFPSVRKDFELRPASSQAAQDFLLRPTSRILLPRTPTLGPQLLNRDRWESRAPTRWHSSQIPECHGRPMATDRHNPATTTTTLTDT